MGLGNGWRTLAGGLTRGLRLHPGLRNRGRHPYGPDSCALMGSSDHRRMASGKTFWSLGEVVRGDAAGLLPLMSRLPLRLWKPRMLFFGARDAELSRITGGVFPRTVVPGKTHPLFCLKILPDGAGARACPCTSRAPSDGRNPRYLRKGCRLLHTGRELDRNTYLVETARFPVPRSVAQRARFWGEAPSSCIREIPLGRFSR